MPADNAWIVIPAYNEGQVLEETVAKALNVFQHVVVIDDCSTDNSSTIALNAGATVCRHPINLGQGAAIQTGISYALTNGAKYIITFDADGQHSIDDALAMLIEIKKGQADVILGSRFLDAKPIGMSKAKRMLLTMATLYTKLTSGLNVTDTHNGLRCFTAQAAKQIRIRHNRMAHASEILNQIGTLDLTYKEVPCTIIYTDYSRAKGQRLSGAFKILYDLGLGKLHK